MQSALKDAIADLAEIAAVLKSELEDHDGVVAQSAQARKFLQMQGRATADAVSRANAANADLAAARQERERVSAEASQILNRARSQAAAILRQAEIDRDALIEAAKAAIGRATAQLREPQGV
jgi:cell division septum initiation protein DivIVA